MFSFCFNHTDYPVFLSKIMFHKTKFYFFLLTVAALTFWAAGAQAFPGERLTGVWQVEEGLEDLKGAYYLIDAKSGLITILPDPEEPKFPAMHSKLRIIKDEGPIVIFEEIKATVYHLVKLTDTGNMLFWFDGLSTDRILTDDPWEFRPVGDNNGFDGRWQAIFDNYSMDMDINQSNRSYLETVNYNNSAWKARGSAELMPVSPGPFSEWSTIKAITPEPGTYVLKVLNYRIRGTALATDSNRLTITWDEGNKEVWRRTKLAPHKK